MFRSAGLWLTAGAGLLGARAFIVDDEYTAPRSATISAAGATAILIDARAGSLRIEGRTGITEVRARGTARATSRRVLEDIKIVTERDGNEVVVRAEVPEHRGWGWDQMALLDLVIEVPAGLKLDVRDSSGETEIRGVASLEIEDSSGNLEIEQVGGPVRVEDSSGDIRVRRIRGDVHVRDSSGEIDVRDVEGSVEIEEDSSGSIEVSDVTGDFIVDRDGSGSIGYDNIKGRVRIPSRKR